MAKLTLNDIVSGAGSSTLYNANNDLIEDAIENTLSLDGTAPNAMQVPLDMNSNRIINLDEPDADSDAATKGYVDDVAASITAGAGGGGGGGVTDHGALLGLADDDHPQYPRTDTYEEINAYWEFTGTDGILITEDPVDYTGFFWNVGAPGAVYQDAEVQADGTYCFCYYSLAMFGDGDSPSNCPGLYMSHYGGTQASPTDLTAGDWIGEWTFATLQADGVGEAVSYRINAVYEAEGVSNNLAAVSLYFKSIHEDESGSLKTRVRFDADGGIVTYGASSVEATGGSQGVGTINCKGVYVDGVLLTGAGAIAVDDLTDVTITAVASGEILKYDGAGWVNNTLTEAAILGLAGGTMTGTINCRSLIPTADSTYNLGSGTYAFAASYVDTYEFGLNTDTSLTRLAAGKLGVEGKAVLKHTGSYTSGEITFSTSDPSGGSSGDIWFKYTA